MLRVRWVVFGCGVLALAAPPNAHAEASTAASPAPMYALSWVRAEGAEECPAGRTLAKEVERRLGRAVFDAAAERSFEVEVTRFGKTYHSDVYVRDVADHILGHRSLQSDEPGCGALVDATALAIALVIDPEAGARQPPPGTSVAAFEPPPAPPAVPVPSPAPPATPPTASPVESRVTAPPAPTLLTASLRAQLTAGLVGAVSPGLELSISARPGPRWGVALAGSYTLSQTVSHGIGSLDLGLTRASALLTFDVIRAERARLVLGGGPTVGAYHLAVRQPSPVTSPGDYWFAGAELGARFQLSVTKGIFVELGGAGLAPPARQEFLVRGQGEPVWRQPLLSGLGFLGVGALVP